MWEWGGDCAVSREERRAEQSGVVQTRAVQTGPVESIALQTRALQARRDQKSSANQTRPE